MAVVNGTANDDSLNGTTAADTINGLAGNDTLVGFEGADALNGGDGIDTINYRAESNANQGVGVNLDTGIGTSWAAGDTYTSIENVIGTRFNDSIGGNADNNLLLGNEGDDTLVGGAGDDILSGGAAAGPGGGAQFGNDTLNGGDGNDTADYSREGQVQGIGVNLATGDTSGQAEGDTLVSIENVIGTTFNDTITGTDGVNVLNGGDGDDLLAGGLGADTIIGGAGFDHIGYVDSAVGVTVDLATGTGLGGTAEGDTLTGIESLQGSNFADTLSGDAGDNRLIGGNGNDTLEGRAGADQLQGGNGIDMASYFTSAAAVTVDLTAGTASGGDAAGDTLTGFEWLRGSAFNDSLTGDAGANLISGEGGDDTVNGGAGNDTLYGEGGADTINGGDGDDRLVGGAGADALDGGAGSDTAYYDNSYTTGVTANLADSSVNTGHAAGDTYNGVENLAGSAFADTLSGNAGVNLLSGWGGDDALNGADGNDVLFGGDGVDTLNGGAGSDKLYGGAGADVFVFSAAADSGVGYGKADLITDFASDDKIDLSAITEGAGSFIGTAQFSHEAGEIRAVSQDNQTSIFVDVDGNGVADMQIRLQGAIALTAGDFVL